MSHGASTRQPVYSGNRRIPGLFQRTLADGSTVYEVSARFAGQMRRHRLEATTKNRRDRRGSRPSSRLRAGRVAPLARNCPDGR